MVDDTRRRRCWTTWFVVAPGRCSIAPSPRAPTTRPAMPPARKRPRNLGSSAAPADRSVAVDSRRQEANSSVVVHSFPADGQAAAAAPPIDAEASGASPNLLEQLLWPMTVDEFRGSCFRKKAVVTLCDGGGDGLAHRAEALCRALFDLELLPMMHESVRAQRAHPFRLSLPLPCH